MFWSQKADQKSQNDHMLKSGLQLNVFDRFFGPKMTKWAHVDLRQDVQWFGEGIFPKNEQFGQFLEQKSTVFYTTFRHGGTC